MTVSILPLLFPHHIPSNFVTSWLYTFSAVHCRHDRPPPFSEASIDAWDDKRRVGKGGEPVKMSKKKSSLTMRLKDNMAAPSRPNSSFPPHPEATSTARTGFSLLRSFTRTRFRILIFLFLLCSSARAPDRYGGCGIGATGPAGRSDLHRHHFLRPRPGSAGAVSASSRGIDDRPLAFFPHPTHISRHFDEDERTPFEASSAPRRPATRDGTLQYPAPPRSEPKRRISSPVVSSPVTAPGSVSFFRNALGSEEGSRKWAAAFFAEPAGVVDVEEFR